MTPRATEPDRRSRLIDVALDVIADVGVAGLSARRVASAADVPLGSITYHFTDMAELTTAAFARFAETVAADFRRALGDDTTPEELPAKLVDLILGVFDAPRNLRLTAELYALAAREPSFRTLTSEWMAASRAVLERHLDPLTARLADAMIEGLSLHLALDLDQTDRRHDVETAVHRILTVPAPSFVPPTTETSR